MKNLILSALMFPVSGFAVSFQAEPIQCFTNAVEEGTYKKFFLSGGRMDGSFTSMTLRGYEGMGYRDLLTKLDFDKNPAAQIPTQDQSNPNFKYVIEDTLNGDVFEVILPKKGADRFYGTISRNGGTAWPLICL